ncbi:MAG: hypothetical protein WC238_03070 [Parcubacteria group bacterium]|jgi:hypothetical protein
MAKSNKGYKIAIFGAGDEKLDKSVYKIAENVGQEIASRGHILITGAAKGISRYAAIGAKKKGGTVIGISPTSNDKEEKDFNVDFKNSDIIIHTGFGYKGRNVVSVRTSDGIIVVNGKFGTLSEVANAEGEQKPIVVLKNSGGCAEMMEDIFKKINPNYELFATANSSKEALDLIEKMIKKIKK